MEAVPGRSQLRPAYAGFVSAAWIVRDSHGDAGEFHAADPEAIRSATFHSVDRPTLVLGSAQHRRRVDDSVATALGVDVVSRRSGGGAVLLWPDEFVWLDIVIPSNDSLWLDDVGRAMHWVGDCWAAALRVLGVPGDVHRGGLIASEWSRDVCFAGVGPGEVVAGASKLVGIAQRRTRRFARFQTMCHLQWRPEIVAALVQSPRPAAESIVGAVAIVPASAASLRGALEAQLRR